MLLVKTQVKSSSIDGLGLFAAESISSGTVIARWDEDFAWSCTEEEFAALPDLAKKHVERYGWCVDGVWRLSVDDSRYMNHSDTPNMSVGPEDGCPYVARAARDIAEGEELTEHYKAFDPDFDKYAHQFRKAGE